MCDDFSGTSHMAFDLRALSLSAGTTLCLLLQSPELSLIAALYLLIAISASDNGKRTSLKFDIIPLLLQ